MVRITACAVAEHISIRALFAAHNLWSIWQVAKVCDNPWFWLIAVAPIATFIECALRLIYCNNYTLRWLYLPILLTLFGSVPPLWLLQLARTSAEAARLGHHSSAPSVATNQISLPFLIAEDVWTQRLLQTLLILLIIGRLVLSKASLNRDQYLHELFIHLAFGADSVVLFALVNDDAVKSDWHITLSMLTVFTVSLLLFAIDFSYIKRSRYPWQPRTVMKPPLRPATETAHPKRRLSVRSHITDNTDVETLEALDIDGPTNCRRRRSTIQVAIEEQAKANMWGLVGAVLLQDAPFLAFRLFVIATKQLHDHTVFYLAAKNLLVIVMELYQLFAACADSKSKPFALG